MVEIFLRQRVHAMTMITRIERIRHQHRVVKAVNLQPVTLQNLRVKFCVLQNLFNRRVGQQRRKQGYGFFLINLRRHIISQSQPVADTMLKGHIGRFARRNGQRDADQIALHRVQTIGFGIDRHNAGLVGARYPVTQYRRIGNCRIARYIKRAHIRRQRAISAIGIISCSRWRRRIISRQFFTGLIIINRPAITLGQSLGQCVELHRFGKTDKLVTLWRAQNHIAKADRQGRIALQRHQVAANAGLIGKLNQILTPLVLLNLFSARQQCVQIAIFINQLGRRLYANARHARHIVNAVAGQRLHINDFVRANTEFFHHTGGVDKLIFHRVDHVDLVAHKLHQILVRRYNGHACAIGCRLVGIGGD